MQFHGRDALEIGRQQVDGDGPFPVAKLGTVHDGASLEGEHGPIRAVPATVRHRTVLDAGLDVQGTAVRANRTIGPALGLNPLLCRLIGREHGGNLDQGDTLAVSLARCFACHVPTS